MNCWQHEIRKARTESEVVRTASDYLTLWAPQELAPLTLGWREVRIENRADIERLKGWLTEGLAGDLSIDPHAAKLHELTDYLWHAVARIEEIRGGH
jgi:hypothetical protein